VAGRQLWDCGGYWIPARVFSSGRGTANFGGVGADGWFVRKQAPAAWERLSEQRIAEHRLADVVHFVFLGDHPLAVDIRGADALRAWLRDQLFHRFHRLRFEVEEMVVEGTPWSTRVATRYVANQDGQLVYRSTTFARVVWGKLADERVLPDTQVLARRFSRCPRDSERRTFAELEQLSRADWRPAT
jgi:ketosteroid isomerase-like protein